MFEGIVVIGYLVVCFTTIKVCEWIDTRRKAKKKQAWLLRGEQNMCPACGQELDRRHNCNAY